MLKALKSAHTCGEACTGYGTVGGKKKRLSCPLSTLNLELAVDRRIVGSLYASAARAAMRRSRA
jgi:hypothetical protein